MLTKKDIEFLRKALKVVTCELEPMRDEELDELCDLALLGLMSKEAESIHFYVPTRGNMEIFKGGQRVIPDDTWENNIILRPALEDAGHET